MQFLILCIATMQSLHCEPKKTIRQVKSWKVFRSSARTVFEADKLLDILMSAAFNVTDYKASCPLLSHFCIWCVEKGVGV